MFDIAIIGAGPAGHKAAEEAGKFGAKIVLIEKENLGGTCLNKGCIPTKTFLNTSDKLNDIKKFAKLGINTENLTFDFSKTVKRKDIILLKLRKSIENSIKEKNITLIKGDAVLEEDNTLIVNDEKIEYKNLILATGSTPQQLPGIERDGDFILNSDDILNLQELPKSILIVGSGAIGTEWARIMNSMGVETTVIELAARLILTADSEISDYIEKNFKLQKIKFFTNTQINKIVDKKVFLSNNEIIEPQKILIAVGRKPDLSYIKSNIKIEKGFIFTDNNLKTNLNNIYAIGDITGKLQFAHTAYKHASEVINYIFKNKPVDINYSLIPSVIYGKPEIASIGLREQDLSGNFKKYTLPVSMLGKATADDESDGFIKLLAVDEKIVGAHIVSKEASALIHFFSLPIKEQISIESLKDIVFAHPTYAEGIHEALEGLK